MRIKTLTILTICIFFISCEKEITIDLPTSSEKIVVEGMIQPGLPITVLISRNTSFFSNFSIDELNNTFINDAEVKVIRKSDNKIKNLTYFEIDPNSSFGVYSDFETFDPSFAIEGEYYKLEISYNNSLITSNTKIPYSGNQENPTIDSVWFVVDNEQYPAHGNFYFHYDDPDTLGNNLMIESKRLSHFFVDSVDNSQHYIQDMQFVKALNGSVRFDFDGLNGTNFTDFFQRGLDNMITEQNNDPDGCCSFKASYYDQESGIFHDADTVLIRFSQVDNNSKNFWRTVEYQNFSGGNPFSEPVNLQHNIDGGIGIWEGKGTIYFKVVAQKDTIFTQRYYPTLEEGLF